MDTISIIVSVYNVEEYIRRAVDSIRCQAYPNLEIILVDDGSPDKSGAICDEYAKMDDRIKVIHKKNGGLSDARNVGIEAATGAYLGFVDGDDYIEPEMYQKLYSALVENDAEISICRFRYVGSK
ncbi:MAG: glycosyltransferase, partial [Clostridiales bacterium]|nr:glycosyltransferase [Clostridiales bacterium]